MARSDRELSRLVKDLRGLTEAAARFVERLDAYARRETPEPAHAAELMRLETMRAKHTAALAEIAEILGELNGRHGRG